MIRRMNYLLKSGGVERAYKEAQELRDPDNYTEIRRNLMKKIGGGTFHFFGSRMMGIGTKDSDLDIFISFGNSYHRGMKLTSIRFFMKKLKYGMNSDRRWQVILIVPPGNWHASFIRAYYRPDDIMVDITFDNGLAVENTLLLAHFFNIQPGAAKLCLFMKQWLKDNAVKMKNYGLVLLVIHFLQMNDYLPTMYTVQQNLEEEYIDGYEVQFNPECTRSSYSIEYLDYQDKDIVEDFFEYYKDFDFEEFIISTKNGNVMNFYDYRNWKCGYINVSGPILDDINVMVNFSSEQLSDFLNLMKTSWEAI